MKGEGFHRLNCMKTFFYVKRPKRNNIHFMAVKMLYVKIIPRARMGSESVAHEAEGRTGY